MNIIRASVKIFEVYQLRKRDGGREGGRERITYNSFMGTIK